MGVVIVCIGMDDFMSSSSACHTRLGMRKSHGEGLTGFFSEDKVKVSVFDDFKRRVDKEQLLLDDKMGTIAVSMGHVQEALAQVLERIGGMEVRLKTILLHLLQSPSGSVRSGDEELKIRGSEPDSDGETPEQWDEGVESGHENHSEQGNGEGVPNSDQETQEQQDEGVESGHENHSEQGNEEDWPDSDRETQEQQENEEGEPDSDRETQEQKDEGGESGRENHSEQGGEEGEPDSDQETREKRG